MATHSKLRATRRAVPCLAGSGVKERLGPFGDQIPSSKAGAREVGGPPIDND